jgi:hypothetical protein
MIISIDCLFLAFSFTPAMSLLSRLWRLRCTAALFPFGVDESASQALFGIRPLSASPSHTAVIHQMVVDTIAILIHKAMKVFPVLHPVPVLQGQRIARACCHAVRQGYPVER